MNGEPEDDEERHPLLGTIVDDDIPHLIDLPPPPAARQEPELYVVEHRPAPAKTYCESCSHVDSHADGCPRGDALDGLAELDREEAALEARSGGDAPEPITPLVRRIGASLLRRVARVLEPK